MTNRLNIAIQNIHLAPNIFNFGIHNYILNLISNGYVKYLYFDEGNIKNIGRAFKGFYNSKHIENKWNDVEFIFSSKTLRKKCDVLLNFNTHTGAHDFTTAVKSFDGLKIWHVGDYFWNYPASQINRWYEEYGIDYIFGYASHDKHCSYFQTSFPKYMDKVIAVPFGFGDRFKSLKPFQDRKQKCVGIGSVNPLRPLEYPVENYRESADYYPDECWFHKWRRMLSLSKANLEPELDVMFPEFPQIKDFGYDIVEKINEYQMVLSCESIFFFPPAKAFEAPACSTVLICADHDCNKEFGFVDGKNCIMHRLYDIDDVVDKIRYYQENQSTLNTIQINGTKLVRDNYTHSGIAQSINDRIKELL